MGEQLTHFLTKQGIDYKRDAPVLTTLHRSRAELVISPTADQVPVLLPLLNDMDTPYHAHGGGSDTLLLGTDNQPLKTVVIDTARLGLVSIASGNCVTAEAGTSIARVSKLTTKQNALTGLEFADGIPGSTAGAVVTDAWHPIHNYEDLFNLVGVDHTAIPKHLRSVLQHVVVTDNSGNILQVPVDQLKMENRGSIFYEPDNDWFILSATFQLEPGDPDKIAKTVQVVCDGRKRMREKNKKQNRYSVGQTLGYSFVVNHPAFGGKTAMQLITDAGSVPNEMIVDGMYHSKATANIICNTGKGSPEGYLRILEKIQEGVMKDHGIMLPIEVRVVR